MNSVPARIHGAAALLVFLAAVYPASGKPPLDREFPAGIVLPGKARGEAAIAALANRLPEVAAFHGKSPQRLRELFRADHSLWVNTEGHLFYACELHGEHEIEPADVPAESIGPTDPPPFDTSEAFLLHSRPGANRVIYLDFDGHVDNTPGNWKDGAYAPPYNIPNSNPGTFSTEERNRIIEVWQRVAEDFSMYEIDVTTEEPNIEDLKKTSSGDTRYGMRVVIGGSGNDWYGKNVGGVAFVGSFDAGNDVPCWVFPAGSGYTAKNITEAASHEVGHTLGLNHDGIEGGTGYYSGHGNWGPIMGVSYTKSISQWSKGEYANPNNTQDDMAVMLTQGAVYRPDDHGGSIAAATELSTDSDSVSTAGVIERNTDLDFFRIEAVGGLLVVNVDPAPSGANLRLEVKLYGAGGSLLQTATSADTSGGTQPVTLSRSVTAGVYYISVDGIGNGDPLTTGYSDYASIGQYNVVISGVVPGGFTWQSVAAGSKQWNIASNWVSGIVPNAAGTNVRVNNDITGSQTIQLTGVTTLGRLFLGDSNNTHAFTLASGGGSLTFDNSGSAANLSKTTGANDVISAPISLLGQLVLAQSASGTLTFTGGIGGTGSLNKTGAGTAVFGTPNTYTGATTLTDGLLRLDNADGLPGGIDNAIGAGESAMSFKGGVLGLASGDFTRQMGAGAGQLNWDPDTGGAGSGGFAAFGADREVRLNNGTSAFSWQTAIIGSNNTLVLGHSSATHTLKFRNGISFAGSKRTVQVEDGEAAVDAILSGALSGGNSSGFTKTGPGVLSLSNSNNTYSGATTVAGGVLRIQNAGALPSGNLEITGGATLGLGAGDLVNRTLGPGVDQLRWTGEGGFAAFGAERAFKFSDSSLNWNTANFISGGKALILGHDTADATLDWQQRFSLAGSTRVIQIDDGSATIDVKMSGIIAGGSSGGTNNVFNKTGAGTLAFTAQHSYWGDTIVSLGTLMIGDGGTTGGISQNSPNISVEASAALAVNRSDTVIQGTNPFKVAVSGEGNFAQVGSGTTVLTLANDYTGQTTVSSGTLALGANQVLPDTSAVSIGTATLDTVTFAETAGTLGITAAATINLGSTGAALAFADSSGIDWTGTLNITGTFVSGSSLRFGTSNMGLLAGQLANISATGFTGFALNGSGFLTATAIGGGYSSWASTNIAGPNLNGDHDNDGVSNGVEYFIGGPNGNTTGFTALPGVTNTGGTLSVTWTRAASYAGTYNTDFVVQTSDTLNGWATADTSGTPATADTVYISGNDVTYTFPAGTKKFARLKVTGP